MQENGRVLAVNISEKKGQKKHNVGKAYLDKNLGIGVDAHSGHGHRQISLLSWSSFEKMKSRGVEVSYGDFAENITVENLDVAHLPLGTRLQVGEALLEVTQIGKECHNQGCAIKKQSGTCVMPLEGVFARVLSSGWVETGDPINIVK
ncbi:MAG: MOSC domain-containing protein [Syntrophomonadaceae bacterium]|jgi:MOSC domain-containing protein YiiM|nr:MOSC domain-containing protein [Syntrophomonadaceae bacterium]HQD90881.1 MOSC domain-containing protein [Syntrophomonadaceae bacterium]